jgi:hypothetical protein
MKCILSSKQFITRSSELRGTVNIAFIGSSIYLLVVILLVTLPVNSRQIDLSSRLLIQQPRAAVTRDRVAILL